jgi:hypothetical protein
VFSAENTKDEKINIKKAQLNPYSSTKKLNAKYNSLLKAKNEVYGVVEFKTQEFDLYLSNLPKFLYITPNSVIRLRLNYKLL